MAEDQFSYKPPLAWSSTYVTLVAIGLICLIIVIVIIIVTVVRENTHAEPPKIPTSDKFNAQGFEERESFLKYCQKNSFASNCRQYCATLKQTNPELACSIYCGQMTVDPKFSTTCLANRSLQGMLRDKRAREHKLNARAEQESGDNKMKWRHKIRTLLQ